jgi:hypothetical protein
MKTARAQRCHDFYSFVQRKAAKKKTISLTTARDGGSADNARSSYLPKAQSHKVFKSKILKFFVSSCHCGKNIFCSPDEAQRTKSQGAILNCAAGPKGAHQGRCA